MYEVGKRVVVRDLEDNSERVMLVEEIVTHQDGNKLRVKDPVTGASELVNPIENPVVECLED